MNLRSWTFLLTLLLSLNGWSVSYQIFSVTQDIPMGTENQIIQKNYFVNIGAKQGVKKGTILDVFRTISVSNPYDNRKRVNYRVKIGELKVIHSNTDGAIARLSEYEKDKPVLDLDQFMVGDSIGVNIN
jgi:hypothetical protein